MTDASTVLVIEGIDIPPYSARGIKQELGLIQDAGQLARTVNGDLINVSIPEFRKYRTTISCEDMQAPAINGIWPGTQVVVHCMVELSYLTATGSPQRTVVDGSSYTDGDYTFYRPKLTMMVTDISTNKDEWGAVVGWSIDLEEV